jgi:hypothetical protein
MSKEFKKIKIGELKKSRFVRYIWTDERQKLKENIIENGFDNNNHYMTITKDNYVLNGNHRFEIMINNFNPDYEVNTHILDVSYKTVSILSILFSIIFFPIVGFKILRNEYIIRKNKIPNEFKTDSQRNT